MSTDPTATTADPVIYTAHASESGQPRQIRRPVRRPPMTEADALTVAMRAVETGTRPADVMTEAESPFGWPSLARLDADEEHAEAVRATRLGAAVLAAALDLTAEHGGIHPSELLQHLATKNETLRAACDAYRKEVRP